MRWIATWAKSSRPVDGAVEQLRHSRRPFAAAQECIVLLDGANAIVEYKCGCLEIAAVGFQDGCRSEMTKRMGAKTVAARQIVGHQCLDCCAMSTQGLCLAPSLLDFRVRNTRSVGATIRIGRKVNRYFSMSIQADACTRLSYGTS
ncbi:hypothetical protein D3C86_1399710 [compost metagenome]